MGGDNYRCLQVSSPSFLGLAAPYFVSISDQPSHPEFITDNWYQSIAALASLFSLFWVNEVHDVFSGITIGGYFTCRLENLVHQEDPRIIKD